MSRSLFAIDEAIETLLNRSVTPEGEIDESALAELEALEMERDKKCLAVGAYSLGQLVEADAICAHADAIAAQADKMRQRAQVHRNHAERLKQYLAAHLPVGTTLEDARVSIRWRKSDGLAVTNPEATMEAGYVRVKREVDKVAAKEAIKAGKEVPGAYLDKRDNVVIS